MGRFILLLFLFSISSQNDSCAQGYFYEMNELAHKLQSSDKKILDSIIPLYKSAKHDTVRLKYLEFISDNISDAVIKPSYDSLILKLSENGMDSPDEKIRTICRRFLGVAFNNFGYNYMLLDSVNKNLECRLKALEIWNEINDYDEVAIVSNGIGDIYYNQGNEKKALEYYYRSLKVYEKLSEKKEMAHTLVSIGFVYQDQKDTANALDCYEKGLAMQKELKDETGIANAYNNIGSVYFDRENFKMALLYARKSYEMRMKINDEKGLAFSFNNIGRDFQMMNENDSALFYFQKGLCAFENLNIKRGVSAAYKNIGTIYCQENDLKNALTSASKSLEISKEINSLDGIRDASKLLYEIFKKQNNWKESLCMHELYITIRDSISNENSRKSSYRQSLNYEFEKKETQQKSEQEKKDVLARGELKQKEQQRNYFIAGFVLVLVFSGFVFRSLKIARQQKKTIEEKQKEILDSIHYAKRIQKSMMPTEKFIESNLKRLKGK